MKTMVFLFCLLGLSLRFVTAASAPAPVDKPKVMLEEMNPFEDKHRVIVPVKVEAKIQSLVTADIEGHVTRILKPLGSVVKRGEVVLYLENKDPGFTYAAVPVRSPVNGVISQFFTTQMTKAVRGDKLFTVIDPKTLKLSAEFPSHEMNTVSTGLKGQFKLNNEKEGLEIRIVGVSPLVDARTGTASAEIEFTPEVFAAKKTLPPIGSVGQATFEISKGQILTIPEASLIYQNGKPMVRVLKGANLVDKKPIELGEQRDGSYVVLSGLNKGDKVVVRSSRPLKENEAVDVETAPVTQQ